MITKLQEQETLTKAYVPEHLVGLMTRVSGGEPFLIDNYFCCSKKDLVIVVGYPLKNNFNINSLEQLLSKVIKKFDPIYVSLIAPELPPSILRSCQERESDYYYTLDLEKTIVRAGLRRVVQEAMQNITIKQSNSLGKAHLQLATEFVERVNPPIRIRELLFKMWDYVGYTDDSLVISAWSHDQKLAAFYVLDFAAKDFSTYVIGCHSKKNYIRGASDSLFFQMIRLSIERGKKYIHLGLGVNKGIRQFKKKWGGIPTLKYEMCELRVRKPTILESIFGYITKG